MGYREDIAGQTNVGYRGAPWFSDDAAMYFGDDKDASIDLLARLGLWT